MDYEIPALPSSGRNEARKMGAGLWLSGAGQVIIRITLPGVNSKEEGDYGLVTG